MTREDQEIESATAEATDVAGASCSAPHGSVAVEWVVRGIAMVPVEVEMVVVARTAGIAECMAQAKFKARPTDYIVSNSYDDTSAHDWVPFVSLNDQVSNGKPRLKRVGDNEDED